MPDVTTEQVVLLCTKNETIIGGAEALSAVGYSSIPCATVRELERELREAVVAVVLDTALPAEVAQGMYRRVQRQPELPILVLLPAPSDEQPDWLLDEDHGDLENFARQPITTPELVLRLNALLVRAGVVDPDTVAMAAAPMGGVGELRLGYGKIICIFSAHGGVGKTTVAVHLAVGLAQFRNARVALIDGDLWMGDSLVFLNVTANRSIVDATANGIPNDPEVWTRVLVDHSSGIKLLAPPLHLEDVERVPLGAVTAATLALRRYFDYVVVDLDDTPTEDTLNVLETADQLLVVLTPELSTVRSTIRLVTTGTDIGLRDRTRLILNRADAGLDLEQLERVLPMPVDAMIPSDGRLFVAALNSGQTVYELDGAGRRGARRAMESLVHSVATYGKQSAQKRGSVLKRLTSLGRRDSQMEPEMAAALAAATGVNPLAQGNR